MQFGNGEFIILRYYMNQSNETMKRKSHENNTNYRLPYFRFINNDVKTNHVQISTSDSALPGD